MEKAKLNRLEEKKLNLMVAKLQEAEAALANTTGANTTGGDEDDSRMRAWDITTGTSHLRVSGNTGSASGEAGLDSTSPSMSTSSGGSDTGQLVRPDTVDSTKSGDPSNIGSSGEITLKVNKHYYVNHISRATSTRSCDYCWLDLVIAVWLIISSIREYCNGHDGPCSVMLRNGTYFCNL